MRSRREFLAAGAASLLAGGALLDASAATEPTNRLLHATTEGAGDYLLSPGLVYLNTGSTGPSTKAVLERTITAWRELENESRPAGLRRRSRRCSGSAEKVRKQAAAFLGCTAEELLITRSTSEGMNTVAQSMKLNAGDRVLSTDQEHEGGTDCWKYLADRRGIVLDTVAITERDG